MALQFTTQHSDDYEPTTVLAPGYYHACIFEYEETKTKNPNRETGRPDDMIRLQIGIYESERQERLRIHAVAVNYYLVFAPKQMWRIERAIKACGAKFDKGQTFTLSQEKFVGRQIAVRTSLNPGKNGGMFVQIDDVLSRDKVPYLGALTPEDYTKFNLDSNGIHNGNNVTKQSRPVAQPAAAPASSNEAEEDFQW